MVKMVNFMLYTFFAAIKRNKKTQQSVMHLYTIIKAETGIKHKSTLKRTPCFGGIGKTWGKQKQHKTPQNTTLSLKTVCAEASLVAQR